MTAEEFLAWDNSGYELVEGELVEVPMGAMSAWVSLKIAKLIWAFLDVHPLGLVFPQETALACWPDRPDHFRKPDGMFFAKGRLLDDRPPDGILEIAPDLAVEVVSPRDNAQNIERKIEEYLDAGVRVIWVCYPALQTIHVYKRGSVAARLGLGDELTGDDVLPGFSVRVADVFDTER